MFDLISKKIMLTIYKHLQTAYNNMYYKISLYKHRPLTFCNFPSASFRYYALFLWMEFSPGQVKRINLIL